MITIIGVVTVLASLGLIVYSIKNKKGVKKGVVGLVVGATLSILPSIWGSMFFTAEQGFNYYVQYPFGGTSSHTTKIGLTWKGFGTVTPFKDFITVSTNQGASEHIKLIDISFADKEPAKQPITYRIETPQDEEGFEEMVVEFRTQANLIRSITPKIQEVVSNTAFMFTGQGYNSGEAPSFNQAVRDQLDLGSYILVADQSYGTKNKSLNADSLKVISGMKSPVLRRAPKLDDNGMILRVKHSFMKSGLSITNVSLPKATFSPEFDVRMAAQRKQSGDFQNSILERKTIIEKTKLEKASGELAKVKEQMLQEKAAVSKITSANTKLLQDSIKLQQSLISEQIAKVEARTLTIQKDAESYAVRKMVSAGISPEKRLKMELDAGIKRAEALSKLKLPTTYIGGGGGSKGGDAMQLLILEAIKNKK